MVRQALRGIERRFGRHLCRKTSRRNRIGAIVEALERVGTLGRAASAHFANADRATKDAKEGQLLNFHAFQQVDQHETHEII